MSCEAFERSILDYQEDLLSAAQRVEVEAHLAGCRDCQAFAQQLRELETALSVTLKVPGLSADFERALRERLQAKPATLSSAQRAERKRQLQMEFEAGLTRLGRRAFTFGSLLNQLTWPAAAATVGWLACRFLPEFAARLHVTNFDVPALNLLPWLAASGVFLAIGLGEAFPRRRKFFP